MSTLVAMQAPWWCPMCGPAGAWGWGMMVLMVIFWIVLIGLAVFLVYRLTRGIGAAGRGRGDAAESILRERFARGEIDHETYQRMLEDLRRDAA